jgi:hypothetical protein
MFLTERSIFYVEMIDNLIASNVDITMSFDLYL